MEDRRLGKSGWVNLILQQNRYQNNGARSDLLGFLRSSGGGPGGPSTSPRSQPLTGGVWLRDAIALVSGADGLSAGELTAAGGPAFVWRRRFAYSNYAALQAGRYRCHPQLALAAWL